MKKSKFILTRTIAVALAFIIGISASITAFAAENAAMMAIALDPQPTDSKIYILPNGEAPEPTEEGKSRYVAYQIFDGDLSAAYSEKQEKNATEGKPLNMELLNISWGKGVNVDVLVNALIKSTTSITVNNVPTTFGARFLESLKEDDIFYAKFSEDKKAELADVNAKVDDLFIAYVQANAAEDFIAQAFARVISKDSVIDNYLVALCKIIDHCLDAENGKTSTWDSGNKRWQIDVNSDNGYYIIVDKYEIKDDDVNESISADMLGVYGTGYIKVKNDIPDVNKKIIPIQDHDDDGADPEGVIGDSGEIGSDVRFQLTGDLPDNYAEYDSYYYSFVDTLSPGLTFKPESLRVYAYLEGKGRTEIPQTYMDKDGTVKKNYTVTVEKLDNGLPEDSSEYQYLGHKITVTFEDLKAIYQNFIPDDPNNDETGNTLFTHDGTELNRNFKIVVEYDATINSNALIGDDPNTNEVYLEYSNDPNSETHGKTTEKKVYVYSFGFDITKQEGSTGTDQLLDGVGFELHRMNGEVDEIAYFSTSAEVRKTDGSNSRTVTVYKLAGWIAADDTKGIEALQGEGYVFEASTANGGKLFIDGISDGDYILRETKTPDSYHPMPDISVHIDVNINEDTGDYVDASVTIGKIGDTDRDDVSIRPGTQTTDGIIDMLFINYTGPLLPGTGGIGTTIIYIVGVLLLALAAVGLLIQRRKN